MARRRSIMAQRMSKMRGVAPEEKTLLRQIGELIDASINNRTPANPFESEARTRNSKQLPPVGVLTPKEGVRSVKIEWQAIDSSILLYYKVRITNLDTGETETDQIAYTNNFTFKGSSGSYRAEVVSVGRNGTASVASRVEFSIPDSVMILEGTKLGISTAGNTISETVLTPKNYQVFVWASFTIDSFAFPTENPVPSVELRVGDSVDNSALIQVIDVFPSSETFANADDSAFSGISRPSPSPGRTATFETSQTIQFDPYEVPDEFAGKNTKFFVVVRNREPLDDVVSLAIVVWVASGGVPDVVGFNARSIDLNGVDEWFARDNLAQTWGIADSWSLSFWVKPRDVSGSEQPIFMLNRGFGFPNPFTRDLILISTGITILNGLGAGGVITIQLGSSGGSIFKGYEYYGNVLSINTWYHLLFTWSGTSLILYINGSVATPTTTINGSNSQTDSSRLYYSGGHPSGGLFGSDLAFDGLFGPTGIWDTALTAPAVSQIYSGKFDIDLEENTGNYTQSGNLVHYYRPEDTSTGITDLVGGINLVDSQNIELADISTDVPA